MSEAPLPLDSLRRALVIKLRHQGDVLLASPVFSALKSRLPDCEIDALVYADTAPMLTQHPAIGQVHVIDRQGRTRGALAQLRAEWQLFGALRARRYDLIVHLTDHPRGAWLSRLCRVPWAVAPKVAGRGRWWRDAFTHAYRAPLHSARHTVEKNLDALRRIGIFPGTDARSLTLVAGREADTRVDRLLDDLGVSPEPGAPPERGAPSRRFIHVHPASRWFFKCWPVERMAALIDRLHDDGHTVVLSAAPSDSEMAMIGALQTRLKHPALSLAGQLSLKELAALTARARLFIGVDSAPMHIAAAMGTPTVALFGPSGDVEWGPWGVAHRVVASDAHPCRPCGIDGCGGGKVSDCLENLPVERVYRAVQEVLAP